MEQFLNEFVEGIVVTTDGVMEVMEVDPQSGKLSDSERSGGSFAIGVFAVIMFLIIFTKGGTKPMGDKK